MKKYIFSFLSGVAAALILVGIWYGITAIDRQSVTADTNPQTADGTDSPYPSVKYSDNLSLQYMKIDYDNYSEQLVNLTNTQDETDPFLYGTRVITNADEYAAYKDEAVEQILSYSEHTRINPIRQFVDHYHAPFPFDTQFFDERDILLIDFCFPDKCILLRSRIKEFQIEDGTAQIIIQINGERPTCSAAERPGGIYLIPVEKGTVSSIEVVFEGVNWE